MLRQLWSIAKEEGLDSAILTFDKHPNEVLCGVEMPLLTIYQERMDLLKQCAPSQIFSFNFELVHDMTAEEFMGVLKTRCNVSLLLMGYDQHFGSDHLQRFSDYEAAAMRVGLRIRLMPQMPAFGMEVKVPTANNEDKYVFTPFKCADGTDMPSPSSSAIRKALATGDVSTANIMLGRPYSFQGLVVEGKHLGRQLGFPTANLELRPGKLVPASGVYLCQVSLPSAMAKFMKLPAGTPLADGEKAYALLNIGDNPTVDGANTTLEIHIPGFDGNLYNKRMNVDLIRFIRPEQKFASLDALIAQIRLDIQQIPSNPPE